MSEQEQQPPAVRITLFGGGGAEISAPVPTPQQQVPAAPVLRPPTEQPPSTPPPPSQPPTGRQPPGQPIQPPPFPGGRFGQGLGRGGISGGRARNNPHLNRSNRFINPGAIGHGPGMGSGGGNIAGPALIGHTGRKPDNTRGGGIGGGGNGKAIPAPFIKHNPSTGAGVSPLAFVGSITAPNAGLGNIAYGGIPFQPKAVIFYTANTTVLGGFDFGSQCIGFAISNTSRAAISIANPNGGFGPNSRRRQTGTACYNFIDTAGTVFLEADFVSMDANGFTLNWTVNAGGLPVVINYLALGGAGLTNVGLMPITSPALAGNVAYSGLGFEPQCLIAISTDLTGLPANNIWSMVSVGFGISSTARGASGSFADNTFIPSDTSYAQSTSRLIQCIEATGVHNEADLVSLDPDGFTLDWITSFGAGFVSFVLCLKGGQYAIGETVQRVTVGTTSIVTGFTPAAVLMISVDQAVDSLFTNGTTKMSIGMASAPGTNRHIWNGVVDNQVNALSQRYQNNDAILRMLSQGGPPPTINAVAQLASLDAAGFTLNWSTVDATARLALYLAIG